MRITVYDILEYFASGMTVDEILNDFPELTNTDIRACFAYSADKEKSQMIIYPTLRTSDFRFSVFISQTCVVPTLSKQFQVNQKKDKWKIES